MLRTCYSLKSIPPGLLGTRPFCASRRTVAGQAGRFFTPATMKRQNLVGNTYGRLTVQSLHEVRNRKGYWNCLCTCGVNTVVEGTHLKSGHTQSCGCIHSEVTIARNFRHGLKWTAEYTAWCNIKARCSNPKRRDYPDYGGRGIGVCARWSGSFDNFLADMGTKPSTGHTIERMNNDGNYEPGNCKWATRIEQAANKRNTPKP